MTTLMEWVTIPLSYPFMQRALVVSVLVAAVCAREVCICGNDDDRMDAQHRALRIAALLNDSGNLDSIEPNLF